jgi:membrane-bound lytic murein transglycosylase A
VLFIGTGCSKKPDLTAFSFSKGEFVQVEWEELPDFEKENFEEAYRVFLESCYALKRKKTLASLCEKQEGDAKAFFTQNFVPYLVYDQESHSKGKITGYYEPLLMGSRVKTKKYRFPLLKKPQDLITLKSSGKRLKGRMNYGQFLPYYDREAITKNSSNYQPICYVDDEVELFYLQIQGSGKIKLTDGSIINVGYSDTNGYAYTSIGKYMIKKGYLQTASMQDIQRFLHDHPDKKDEILFQNRSYIFFKENRKGAMGSIGVELTPERSVAIDHRYLPLGYPLYLSTTHPATKQSLQKIVFAHDTGNAIKGRVRADFFWGFGSEALKEAGRMNYNGKMWLFVPKSEEKM